MWFMKRLYSEKWKGKRTTIAIDPKLKKRIDELLKDGETFGEFVRDAINQDIWSKEDRSRSDMTSTEQYHKMKQLEEDVKELQRDSDKQKELSAIIENSLKRKLASFESYSEYMIQHYLPTIKKITKESHNWLREE